MKRITISPQPFEILLDDNERIRVMQPKRTCMVSLQIEPDTKHVSIHGVYTLNLHTDYTSRTYEEKDDKQDANAS